MRARPNAVGTTDVELSRVSVVVGTMRTLRPPRTPRRSRGAVAGIAAMCAVATVSCGESEPGSAGSVTSPVVSQSVTPNAPIASSTQAPSDVDSAMTSNSSAAGSAAVSQGALSVGESVQGNPRLSLDQFPPPLLALQQAIMSGDRDTFARLFTENALVVDGSREFRGVTEIGDWAAREVLREGSHYDVFEIERQSADTYRWTLAFQRNADSVADAPRGCATLRIAADTRIEEWILGGCEL